MPAKRSRILITPPGRKYCPRCDMFKLLTDFYSPDESYCKPCSRAYRKERDDYKNRYMEYLEEAKEHYGFMCSKCGELHPNVLTIHPLEGEGQFVTLKYLHARGWPVGYGFSCLNCKEKEKHVQDNSNSES